MAVAWYAQRIPVGFAVHVLGVLLMHVAALPTWLVVVMIVWHEVGKVLGGGRQQGRALSASAGRAAAAAGACLSALDWYIEARYQRWLWPHAALRGLVVFAVGVALRAAWKDIFGISYLLLAITACTKLFVSGPIDDFIAHASVIAASDAFQYFIGKRFGRHKAVPSVSPNKTLEGYAGGVILCNLLSLVFAVHPTDADYLLWYNGILVSGIIGDLAISSWKRFHVVKDTSDMFASHGGMLDRLDSHIAALTFTTVFCEARRVNFASNYTGLDASRTNATTALVWAAVWARFFYMRRKLATNNDTNNASHGRDKLH